MLRRLPLLYLAAVAAIALVRAISGHPTASTFALTPDRLASGRIWRLATSAFVISGPPLLELAGLGATIVAAQRRLGARLTVAVMVVAHVFATLIAYALLTAFTGDPDGSHNRKLDYGISAVWLGLLGAVAADAWPSARRGLRSAQVLVAIGGVSFVISVALFPLLAAIEHGIAFVLGAGLAVVTEARAGAHRSARSAASRASAPTASV